MSGQVQKQITDYFVGMHKLKNKDGMGLWEEKVPFATILELPNELLLSILDHLHWETEYCYIIRRLNRVCKRFSLVVGPLVRESLRLETYNEHGFLDYTLLQSERVLSQLRYATRLGRWF